MTTVIITLSDNYNFIFLPIFITLSYFLYPDMNIIILLIIT